MGLVVTGWWVCGVDAAATLRIWSVEARILGARTTGYDDPDQAEDCIQEGHWRLTLGLSLWRLTSLQELLEGGIVAKRIEIRILFRVLAEPLGKVDRLLQVLHCGRAVAGQALQAREVVEQQSVLRSLGHELTWICSGAGS